MRICTWVLLYLVMSRLVNVPGRLIFLGGKQGGMDLGQKEGGGRDERNEERESFGKGLHTKEEKTYFYKEKIICDPIYPTLSSDCI